MRRFKWNNGFNHGQMAFQHTWDLTRLFVGTTMHVFFWTAPNQLKNGYMFDKWWLSNGYCWWWLSYGVVHAASIVQTAAQEHMLYAHVFIPKKAKRDEIQHHTAKQGDNHAKEQMLVFSFGERCCALPPNDTPSAPFLHLQYPRKWQDHRSNIFSLPEEPYN